MPAAIIILSIFFLNTFIDSDKEEKIKASDSEAPVIHAGNKKVKAVFLSSGETNLTKKMVADAAKKAAVLRLAPYENGEVQLAENQDRMFLSEWDPIAGKELKKQDWYQIEGTINRFEPIIYLIRVNIDGRPATYLTKVQMLNVYSYQKHLNPDLTKHSFFILSDEEGKIDNFSFNEPGYITSQVNGPLAELQNMYPDLGIEKLPSIYIFNGLNRIFKSEDMDEMRSLTTEVKTHVYEGANGNWQVQFNAEQGIYKRNAEFFITYKGTEPITEDIDISLEGEHWGWGAAEGSLQSGILAASGETPVFLSKSDKLSIVLRWDGKEERIALGYKGEK
ncbi:hypothetical protein DRW41_16220 [Neobacillus piezotolerans]|uniref:Uncharacterized protein n=1 Tax=Neobacillus piezotolerans TaxID=2259171 RepID=A0A3D8GMI5_9BACI|nr:hypothetical protein [Neobacillus piezotolerans]RDU35690.1 hypothetical protein DRW41_16220 [Neobacillus piezotolerans]